MARNQWIDDAYVNNIGQRIATREPQPDKTLSSSHYTYTSSTLKIDLRKKSMHGVSYWAAKIHISSPSQLRSALSYGTYGGTRQTTSSAVSSNGGIIGVNGSAFSYQTGKPSPLGMCIKNGKIYGRSHDQLQCDGSKKRRNHLYPCPGTDGKRPAGRWGKGYLQLWPCADQRWQSTASLVRNSQILSKNCHWNDLLVTTCFLLQIPVPIQGSITGIWLISFCLMAAPMPTIWMEAAQPLCITIKML